MFHLSLCPVQRERNWLGLPGVFPLMCAENPPPGCTNGHHKRAEGTAVTNVTFYKPWQVNMPSCRQHFAVIMIHSLRASPIDINSSIVSRRANGLNKHPSRNLLSSATAQLAGRDCLSTPFSMCSNIGNEKAASIVRHQCPNPLMC